MPSCASQIILCDVPVRFDTYSGCSHGCEYCFTQRRYDISNIKPNESAKVLISWIEGKRNKETEWCDWAIPLHWGGLSDPFQPIERKAKRSLECLKVFAKTKYPFIVSTKNKLIAEEPYFSLIKECDCVVQFSALCDKYDAVEKGASTFAERLQAASKIAQHKRVIIRCQPYLPAYFADIMANIKKFAGAGVYGIVFESMKFLKKQKGTVRVMGDWCYPTQLLKKHFTAFKAECHRHGLKFYSGENRLRAMGDSLCCCGADGLGWKTNTANLNHYIYDRQNYIFTPAMERINSAIAFKGITQSTLGAHAIKNMSYKDAMNVASRAKLVVGCLLPDDVRYTF